MTNELTVKDSAFTNWVLGKARAAGLDMTDSENVAALRLSAALILTKGVEALNHSALCSTLGVTLGELESEAKKSR